MLLVGRLLQTEISDNPSVLESRVLVASIETS